MHKLAFVKEKFKTEPTMSYKRQKHFYLTIILYLFCVNMLFAQSDGEDRVSRVGLVSHYCNLGTMNQATFGALYNHTLNKHFDFDIGLKMSISSLETDEFFKNDLSYLYIPHMMPQGFINASYHFSKKKHGFFVALEGGYINTSGYVLTTSLADGTQERDDYAEGELYGEFKVGFAIVMDHNRYRAFVGLNSIHYNKWASTHLMETGVAIIDGTAPLFFGISIEFGRQQKEKEIKPLEDYNMQ